MSDTYTDLQYTTFPDTIQSFVTMLNMVVSDASAINGYQEAMRSGDYDLAQRYFDQITNGNQKMLDATKLNTLMDTCVALQRFYQSDIEPHINNLHTSWLNEINQFSYLGDYSASTQYNKNNFVTLNINETNYVFICVEEPPIGTSPSLNDTQYWRQLSIKGIQGISGVGMSFRFHWLSGETYYVEDVVTYNDGVWGCVIQNTNQAPYEGSSYWRLIHKAIQDLYPFSATEPSSLQTGSLWFQIV